MTIELRNAPTLAAPRGFSHASIAPAGSLVHLAGQVGSDIEGTYAEGLEAQTERAMLNLLEALKGAGGAPENLVKLTYFIVGGTPDAITAFGAGLRAATKVHPVPRVPATLLYVQGLLSPEALVEIEGVAVLGA